TQAPEPTPLPVPPPQGGGNAAALHRFWPRGHGAWPHLKAVCCVAARPERIPPPVEWHDHNAGLLFRRAAGQRRAHEAVARNQRRELRFAQTLGPLWTDRQ